eukprot:gene17213-biopygen2530
MEGVPFQVVTYLVEDVVREVLRLCSVQQSHSTSQGQQRGAVRQPEVHRGPVPGTCSHSCNVAGLASRASSLAAQQGRAPGRGQCCRRMRGRHGPRTALIAGIKKMVQVLAQYQSRGPYNVGVFKSPDGLGRSRAPVLRWSKDGGKGWGPRGSRLCARWEDRPAMRRAGIASPACPIGPCRFQQGP